MFIQCPVPVFEFMTSFIRCEKCVYLAELMRGAGKAWHKGCFTCYNCNKRVDSTTLCEREGEIYCKGRV